MPWWPVVSRKVHELELALVRAELDHARHAAQEAREHAAYWRTRCERLTDAALQRAGAIHEPAMVDRPVERPRDLASLVAGLAVREIDSTREPT